ncbi:hypothetical protein QBZ16_000794 [Prototheca wickerhamii]|uniref:Uncharacterized protein n=1 Tax=Prototheca wickerhamii TaxID=3111 RepID=A0AAD9MMB7_PROWI|nr:hypothetical protein QBZ16_000794 [Prototheca wickerhamii]
MVWKQHEIRLPAFRRGCHLVTKHIVKEVGPTSAAFDRRDDDMPAHVKSSLFGSSVSIPITGGRLNLGTWQGIWLCEHRDAGGPRRLVVTIQGE